MKKWIIIIAAAFTMLGASGVLAQISPCWVNGLALKDSNNHEARLNPDSVMIDTCTGSATYLHKFAEKWFHIEFQKVIFEIPTSNNADTIIERGWRDIDSNETNLRNAFESIEQMFGLFTLQKQYPYVGDTASKLSQDFMIAFDNYVDIDSATDHLKNISDVSASYWNRFVGENRVTEIGKGRTNSNNQGIVVRRFLLIDLPSFLKPHEIEIYDEKGGNMSELVTSYQLDENTTRVDCGRLSRGTYTLRMSNFVQRFLISK